MAANAVIISHTFETLELLKPKLTADHYAILVLALACQSYEQMSEALGLKMGTVKSRLYRARVELTKLVEAA